MQGQVKEWLEEGKIDVFLGYKMVRGHPLPYFFSQKNLDELKELMAGPAPYPLEKIALKLAARSPDIKIGMLSRDFDQRALNVLFIWNQLNADHLRTIPVKTRLAESPAQAETPYPGGDRSLSHRARKGIEKDMDIQGVEELEQDERFKRWSYEFEKCIKCYGCRNICPVCFCKECSLEHQDLVGSGALPVEIPIFHLIRAVHMGGRCIDCGLCEEACPAGIPLRLLYRKVNEIVSGLFDYKTGMSPSQSPFTVLGEKGDMKPEQIRAA